MSTYPHTFKMHLSPVQSQKHVNQSPPWNGISGDIKCAEEKTYFLRSFCDEVIILASSVMCCVVKRSCAVLGCWMLSIDLFIEGRCQSKKGVVSIPSSNLALPVCMWAYCIFLQRWLSLGWICLASYGSISCPYECTCTFFCGAQWGMRLHWYIGCERCADFGVRSESHCFVEL